MPFNDYSRRNDYGNYSYDRANVDRFGSRNRFGYNDRLGGYNDRSAGSNDKPAFGDWRNSYKNGNFGRYSNQEQRRRYQLDQQARQRRDRFSQGRNFGGQRRDKNRRGGGRGGGRKPAFRSKDPPKPRKYKDILSYSEYLLERPDDLEQWIVVVCPKGKRCCLVANKGTTTVYDKSGNYIRAFPSDIPGGNDPDFKNPRKAYRRKSILDCIYVAETETYYVLDVIMWNAQPFDECETSLRFFWLETHFHEFDLGLTTIGENNWHKIIPATRFTVIEMQHKMVTPHIYPNGEPKTDGFLFYHPEAIYTSGNTPLVGWLKGFMIPEVIQAIQVNDSYLEEKPAEYIDLTSYVNEHGNSYGKKQKKASKKTDKNGEKMETEGTAENADAGSNKSENKTCDKMDE